MGIIKAILVIFGLLSLFFAAIPPLMYGMFNAGVAALFVLAALCFLQVYLLGESRCVSRPWEVFAGKGSACRFLRRFLGICLSLFFVAEAAFSGVMVWKGWSNLPTNQRPTTAVVMGCLIKGDQPSKILQNRLEKALLYLTDRPEAKVVVTGGQGTVEEYPEADIEAKWLIERGISPDRIIIENRSLDTYENMENTAALLMEKGLPMEAVLFTDGFHQYRSQYYARLHGITVTGIPSPTPWGLFPSYWVREQAAICEMMLMEWGILPHIQ
ncbi:MAG: YdcF family protein [Angelakisella sp.]